MQQEMETIDDEIGKILFAKTSEIVSLQSMLDVLEFLKQDKSLPRNLRILEDATDSVVSFGVHDFPKIVAKLKDTMEVYQSIHHAVIHNSPVNTAYTLLMKNQMQAENYSLEVFSTRAGALNWLHLSAVRQ